MKRLSLLFASLSLVLLPFSASAMTVAGGDQYELPQGVAVSDDVYAGGGTLVTNGTVNGDLVVAGGNITVNGQVSQDILAAGGNLTLLGVVGDDVRAAGGSIVIGNTVKGDVVVGGGTITILKSAVIEGDLAVGGGSIVIDGNVKGKVRVAGGKVTINGTIGDEVDIRAGQEVSFGPNAKIAKAVRYTAPQEAAIDPQAVLQIKPEFTLLERPDRGLRAMGMPDKNKLGGLLSGLLLISFVFKALALMLAALVALWLMPKAMLEIVERGVKAPGKVLMDGFVWAFIPPILGILLVITLLGSLLGGAVLVGYGLLVVAAKIAAPVIAGVWLFRTFSKKKEVSLDWKVVVIGTLLVMALSLVPIIGWIICLLAYLLALGGLAGIITEKWNARKK